MKYVYDGEYTQFMGRQFAFRKPVEITDKATLQALEKNPHFRKVKDEEIQEAPKAVLSDECPKCHRIVKRGKFMHQKHCSGK